MAKPLPHYVTETQNIRAAARNPDCRWQFTTHALEQMQTRKINAPSVSYCLTNCRIELAEQKRDLVYRVVGRDEDGEVVKAAVAVFPGESPPRIKVITVFD